MNLSEAIDSVDFEDLIDRMNAYAISRLRSVGIKNFNGREPIDFVGDLILKVMEGKRDWDNARCSFKDFLFGCLRSEISNFFNTNNGLIDVEIPDIASSIETVNLDEQRKQIAELLCIEGADDHELIVFECWADGILKPAEIAKDLGIKVREVYVITKRLERKIDKIKSRVTDII